MRKWNRTTKQTYQQEWLNRNQTESVKPHIIFFTVISQQYTLSATPSVMSHLKQVDQTAVSNTRAEQYYFHSIQSIYSIKLVLLLPVLCMQQVCVNGEERFTASRTTQHRGLWHAKEQASCHTDYHGVVEVHTGDRMCETRAQPVLHTSDRYTAGTFEM